MGQKWHDLVGGNRTYYERSSVKKSERFGLGDLILSLYRDRYTGLVILHLAEGTPKKAEFPGRQIPLATGPEANIERKADEHGG